MVTSMLEAALAVLLEASPWLLFSFIVGGIVHALVPLERMRILYARGSGRPLLGAVGTGFLLPMCSCGVIPLGISLYYTGARLGTTLALMTATPMLNPVSVLLAYALLGPDLMTAYLIAGLTVSFAIGLLADRLAGPELYAPGVDGDAPPPVTMLNQTSGHWSDRMVEGLRWSWEELGPMVGRYLFVGLVLTGIFAGAMPDQWTQAIFDGGFVSLLATGAIAALIYVCPIAHMPLVGYLVANGAAPGAALVFLMAGAATNIPELVNINSLIGRRAAALYFSLMTAAAITAGLIANAWLGDQVVQAPEASRDSAMNLAHTIAPMMPAWLMICTSLIIGIIMARGLYLWGVELRMRQRDGKPRQEHRAGSA